MIKKNILLSIRLMGRNKLFSILNIAGFAFGLACAILLYLWINDELSYNKFHEKVDRIYLVRHWQHYGDNSFCCPVGPGPMAQSFKDKYPEVEEITRYTNFVNSLVSVDNKKITKIINCIDPNYFNIFTCPLVHGSHEAFQNDPNAISITESIAKQFFGKTNPIGQIMLLDDKYSFTVRSVVKDFPNNVDYDFNLAVHFSVLENYDVNIDTWHSNFCFNFALLKPTVDYNEFSKKSVGFMDEMKENSEDNKNELFLHAFKKMHLYEHDGKGGRIVMVKIFALVTIFILLLACFNYTNLSTARASNRAKEIAVRKVMSASKKRLIAQFLGESFIFTFIALNFSLVIVRLLLPYFNNMAGKSIVLNYTDNFIILSLVSFWIITSILAGLYPAFVLSSFGIIKSLKDSKTSTGKGGAFRKVLVITQFTFSIGLILLTLLISRQVNHMKNLELGYNKENLIYVGLAEKMHDQYSLIRSELIKNPDIINVTQTTHHSPTMCGSNSGGWNWEGKDEAVNPLVGMLNTDTEFPKTFEIKMLEGRYFSPDHPSDTACRRNNQYPVVINKTFADIIGLDNITDHFLTQGGDETFPILGVIDDFAYLPKNREHGPLIIYYNPERRANFAFIRVTGKNTPSVLSHIDKTLNKFSPGSVFNYGFVDDAINMDYRAEERVKEIFKAFAIFAIIISCLGLFGLAAFSAQKRVKEIGIRKAMGAPVLNIVALLSSNMAKWILIANVLACIPTYFLMDFFLQQFPYKTNISIWIFVVTAIGSISIALLTVMYHAVSASLKNPVDSLRYE